MIKKTLTDNGKGQIPAPRHLLLGKNTIYLHYRKLRQ